MQKGLFRYDVTACETKVLFRLLFYSLALLVYLQIVKTINFMVNGVVGTIKIFCVYHSLGDSW